MILGWAIFAWAQPESCASRLKTWEAERFDKPYPYWPTIAIKVPTDWKVRLTEWSADLLIETARTLDQQVRRQCDTPFFQDLSDSLKRQYLASIGAKPSIVEESFRQFVSLPNERTHLPPPGRPLRGVWVLGANPSGRKKIEEVVERLCPQPQQWCPFWNQDFLYRVVMVPASGVSAYVPEVGTIYMSSDIVAKKALESHWIVAHELAHVAIYAWGLDFPDKVKQYYALSDWPANLSLNEKSLKPILRPNHPSQDWPALRTALKDFVLERSLAQAIKTERPEEAFADHVVAIALAPDLFCINHTPVALTKYQFLQQNPFSWQLPARPADPCKNQP